MKVTKESDDIVERLILFVNKERRPWVWGKAHGGVGEFNSHQSHLLILVNSNPGGTRNYPLFNKISFLLNLKNIPNNPPLVLKFSLFYRVRNG